MSSSLPSEGYGRSGAPAPDPDAADVAWRRTHPATALVTTVRHAPRAVLLLIPLFLRFRLWGLLVAGLALVAWRALVWYTTTYRLGRAEIVVRLSNTKSLVIWTIV